MGAIIRYGANLYYLQLAKQISIRTAEGYQQWLKIERKSPNAYLNQSLSETFRKKKRERKLEKGEKWKI